MLWDFISTNYGLKYKILLQLIYDLAVFEFTS
jgi:hypothetical protein